MILTRSRRAIAIAGITVAAAAGAAGGAQAAPSAERCEQRLERLEAKFRKIEAKKGYDEAVEWWPGAWQRYYERCEV
jgi:hypothetical protein